MFLKAVNHSLGIWKKIKQNKATKNKQTKKPTKQKSPVMNATPSPVQPYLKADT